MAGANAVADLIFHQHPILKRRSGCNSDIPSAEKIFIGVSEFNEKGRFARMDAVTSRMDATVTSGSWNVMVPHNNTMGGCR